MRSESEVEFDQSNGARSKGDKFAPPAYGYGYAPPAYQPSYDDSYAPSYGGYGTVENISNWCESSQTIIIFFYFRKI